MTTPNKAAATMANPVGDAAHARQLMEQTAIEKQSRSIGSFAEIEAEMPILRSRRRASIIDKLSAGLLGEHNPLAHPVNPRDHTVWLFENTAWPKGKNEWKAEVLAAYFVKHSGQDESEAVAKISEILGLAEGDEARAKVAKRLQPFLDSVLPAHTAQMEIDGQKFKLGPSSTDGITSDIVRFKSKTKAGTSITPQLIGMASTTPTATYFAEEEGWAIISDVDDTIKKTMTNTALGVLKTTFVEDPEPITGMPELYQHVKTKMKNPPFWYLSASPYNLYPFLLAFRDQFKFPPGQMILRDASWMSLAGLLTSITQGTQAYKVDRMKKIQTWFPKRKFVCIGDSTQTDPEAYAEMYEKHPDWIKAIFIRKVQDVEEIGADVGEKIKPERFEKAFKNVPKEVWYVYEDPKELYEKFEALSKTSAKFWSSSSG